ncbi:MAG TPA: lipase maturation factor family protein [Bacillota bacterium]|nr:lipase maturation factor family protein [Bacillota bacterium]
MREWLPGLSIPGAATYALSGWLFLRLLGFIYLAAFLSLATQIKGLAGREGILPAAEFLQSRMRWGMSRFYRLPTLCWFNASDRFLSVLCWSGALLALLLVLGIAPLFMLVLLWADYLSLFVVCRLFLSYQWDILLLETGFGAIFLAPIEVLPHFPPSSAPPFVVVWLLWWLLFRLLFSSGVVKLRSGDPTWRNLSALCHHYETQPLPTPLAWHAHQLSAWFHKLSAVMMLGVELIVPFFIFGPAPLRYVAATSFILLMLLIQLTGNYSFFNLLSIALSFLLLDDQALRSTFQWLIPSMPLSLAAAPLWRNWLGLGIAAFLLGLSAEPVLRLFRFDFQWPKRLGNFVELLTPFRLVNSYGLFAVMTTERPEIIVEGSRDGVTWLAYDFKWKPGPVERAPRFVAPHQPRLDWQLWFAALGYYPNHPWVLRFLTRLLEGSPAVLALLRTNPFPESPPRYVRGILYEYRFTTRAQRRATGAWWRRERRGDYCPILELNPDNSEPG